MLNQCRSDRLSGIDEGLQRRKDHRAQGQPVMAQNHVQLRPIIDLACNFGQQLYGTGYLAQSQERGAKIAGLFGTVGYGLCAITKHGDLVEKRAGIGDDGGLLSLCDLCRYVRAMAAQCRSGNGESCRYVSQ